MIRNSDAAQLRKRDRVACHLGDTWIYGSVIASYNPLVSSRKGAKALLINWDAAQLPAGVDTVIGTDEPRIAPVCRHCGLVIYEHVREKCLFSADVYQGALPAEYSLESNR